MSRAMRHPNQAEPESQCEADLPPAAQHPANGTRHAQVAHLNFGPQQAAVLDAGHHDATVLLCGATGTGKTLAARAIHQSSQRSSYPFVAVNCATLTPELACSALFGHRRGSFTGAVGHHCGYFAASNRGTLFLDEIGDLPLAVQAQVLAAIESRTVTALGSSVQTRVDCRLICATNRNLTQEVRRGRFRADLLERISDEYIQLAELRSRIHDLPELISTMQNEMGITPPYTFHVDAVQRMQSYAWPGNLRELHKTIARLSRREVVKHTRQVHASDLVFGLLGPDVDHPPLAEPVVAMSRPPSEPYGEGWVAADGPWALGSIHRQKSVLTSGRVEHALQAAQGNHTHAARLLGVKRTSLLRWLSVQRDVSTDPRATSRDSPRGGGGTKIR